MALLKKVKLGELLIQNNVITQENLDEAIAHQRKKGGKLGKVLVDLQFLDETTLLNFLSRQLNIPFIELKHYDIKKDLVTKLPEALSRRFRALVLEQVKGTYLVGMSDPTDLAAIDEINRVLGVTIKPAAVKERDLLLVINEVYRRTEEISSFATELKQELGSETAIVLEEDIQAESAKDAPVVKLIRSLFEDAVQIKASDVHIEPDEKFLRIRQRVDGILNEHIIKEKGIASAVISRLKLMASLNISEKRVPQDGRFHLRVGNKLIDIRMSTMPIRFGESVVMRILDKSEGMLKLEELGIPDDLLDRLRYQIHRPYGMIVVTGPTGSGKTTTLYAALSELNVAGKKIITAEDPIEYTLSRVNQVQVNPKIDLTFARILRSALRQDPDIIMVGEMRDEETARIGIRAAITGHLVLSTLHTNDALSSAQRLIDMNVEGYMVASALRAIIAQRLVRRVCEYCVTDYNPTPQEQAWIKKLLGDDKAEDAKFIKGRGCSRCNKTGYRGRVGVYEFLEISEKAAQALRENDTMALVKAVNVDKKFKTLAHSAMEAAANGITSLDEVMRVATDAPEPHDNNAEL